jgi:hypothetical protein
MKPNQSFDMDHFQKPPSKKRKLTTFSKVLDKKLVSPAKKKKFKVVLL